MEKRKASAPFSGRLGKTGQQRRPGGIGEAYGTVLEAGVDAGLLDFADQLIIEALIGFGFPLEGLVFEGAGVEVVEFGLGLRHGLLEHVLAVGRFLEFEADPLRDVGLQGSELAFQFGHLGERLRVFGMVGAVLRFHAGEFLAGLIQAVGEFAELLALGGCLGGFQRAALDGIVGGLLADAIALRGGELGIDLEQAGGEDAGLLVGVDHAQILFKLRQGGGGALHFGLELFHLLFHEGGEAGAGAEADVIGVLDVAIGDAVGDIGGQFGIWRTVADEQQIGIRRARDLELLENDRSVLRRARWGAAAAAVEVSTSLKRCATGRRTESDWMVLTWVARN